MSDGGLGTLRRARRRCVVDWALEFWEAVSMQRLRLAARLVNASPSLMALLQSDAGRAWKAELSCDIELLRGENGPHLVEVEGLSDFQKLWFEFQKAWKLLASSCQRKLVERRQRSETAPVPIPPFMLSFPFFRPPVATSARLFATSSGPFGHTR